MNKQVLLYLPVMHAGYEAFLDRHADADGVLLLGRSFAEVAPSLAKDIRALDPEHALRYVRAGWDVPAEVIELPGVAAAVQAAVLVAPDEDVIRDVIARFGLDAGRSVVLDSTFLRWDRPWSLASRPVGYDGVVSADDGHVRLARLAADEASRSSDWWRRVGAVAVRDGTVVARARNAHVPTEYAPYLNGDPRDNFSRGVRPDLSTAIHAEAALVADAARTGLALDGCDLFVSTFPCPPCARIVARAGFARCFFTGPYAMLDGEQVLRAAGVALVWVDLEAGPEAPTPAAN